MREITDTIETNKDFLEGFLTKLISQREYLLPALGTLVSLFLAMLGPALANVLHTFDIAGLVAAIILLVLVSHFIIKRKKRRIEEIKDIFNNDIPKEDITKIPRDLDAKSMAEPIYKSDIFFHIVTGSSGSGKSFLIKNYFIKKYKTFVPSSWTFRYIYIDPYEDADIQDKICKELEGTQISELFQLSVSELENSEQSENDGNILKTRVILVIDQFESIFLQNKDDSTLQLKNLCNIFKKFRCINKKYQHKAIDCVVIIRKEYFFDLKFFEDYLPHIKEVKVIEGFDIKEDGNEVNNVIEGFDIKEDGNEINKKLVESLKKFHFNEEVRSAIIRLCTRTKFTESYYITSCEKATNPLRDWIQFHPKIILPVELMTVAESVKFNIENNDGNYSESFTNNIQLTIGDFFKNYCKAYESPDDVYRVFYTLSVSPRARRFLTPKQISSLANVPYNRVKKILQLYSEKKEVQWRNPIIRQVGEEFDWRHDFYAERFNETSGTVLDPVDRDNISFFFSRKSQCEMFNDNKNQVGSEKFGACLFLCSFILLFLRTFYPLLLNFSFFQEYSEQFQPFFTYQILLPFAKNIDFSFLPIFFSLTLWSWYVTTLYRRVLSHLGEKKFGSAWFLSQFVTIFSFICVVLTVLYPVQWLTFTGIGGFVVGLKYFQITNLIRKNKSLIKIPTYSGLWIETVINSVVVIMIGSLFYARLFPPDSILSSKDIDNWGFTITLFCGAVMIYFSLISILDHTSYKRVPKLLGIYKRFNLN